MNAIVGMDWINQFEALIDSRQKIVRSWTLSGGELTIWGKDSKSSVVFCSATRSRKYPQHGCEGFLTYVVDTKKKDAIPEVLVVCEFPDVFLKDLCGVTLG